jgi:hypothetical protein
VQGLSNERVWAFFRAKEDATLLSECIDAAMAGESAIFSAKERGSRPLPQAALLSECTDAAMAEESAIVSAKERGSATPRSRIAIRMY